MISDLYFSSLTAEEAERLSNAQKILEEAATRLKEEGERLDELGRPIHARRIRNAAGKGLLPILEANEPLRILVSAASEIATVEKAFNDELQNPKYAGMTLKDILEATTLDESGKPAKDSLFMRILQEARARAVDTKLYKNLFGGDYQIMLNNKPVTETVRFTKRDFEANGTNTSALCVVDDNLLYEQEIINDMTSGFPVSATKILFASIFYFTEQNFYKSSRINPIVAFRLEDFLTATKCEAAPRKMPTEEEQEKENKRFENYIKYKKREIRKDLDIISSTTWTGHIEGSAAGDYRTVRIISSHSIRRGIIEVSFDPQMALFLNRSYTMQYPLVLLQIKNSNANAWGIGNKIALHCGNLNNYIMGTAHTLTVGSLLCAAPEIITKKELDSQDQNNWRQKIKDKLERALDYLCEIGYLRSWRYRSPQTKEYCTREEASTLSWKNYKALRVDFELCKEPVRPDPATLPDPATIRRGRRKKGEAPKKPGRKKVKP